MVEDVVWYIIHINVLVHVVAYSTVMEEDVGWIVVDVAAYDIGRR